MVTHRCARPNKWTNSFAISVYITLIILNRLNIKPVRNEIQSFSFWSTFKCILINCLRSVFSNALFYCLNLKIIDKKYVDHVKTLKLLKILTIYDQSAALLMFHSYWYFKLFLVNSHFSTKILSSERLVYKSIWNSNDLKECDQCTAI